MSTGALSGKTRFMGILGDPLEQARSPALANARLVEQGLWGQAVLIPMQVAAGELPAVLAGLRPVQNFLGAIVTMPHKQAVLPLLDSISVAASVVGAVNVLRRDAAGRLHGDVFDGEGFVAGLAQAGHGVAGRRCLLLGSGGAASAIACALAAHGAAAIDIVNRNQTKAELLAGRVRGHWPATAVACPALPGAAYDLVINGTSLGMREGDPLPVSEAVIATAGLVAEVVVTREWTPLLLAAQAQGRPVHAGLHMLTAQMELLLGFMLGES